MTTLFRAPHHITTSIAVIANYSFQLDAFFSWYGRDSSLDQQKYKMG